MAAFDFEEIRKLKVFRGTSNLEIELRKEELNGEIATTKIKTEMYQETQQDMHDDAVDNALKRAGATEEQRHRYWRAHPSPVLADVDLEEVFKEPEAPKPAGAVKSK